MADESTALSLLGGLEFEDPRLYGLLEALIRDLYSLDRQINPPTVNSFGASGIQVPTTDEVLGFSASVYSNNIRLTWTSLGSGVVYEIRYVAGGFEPDLWDTANSILTTSTLSADINPVTLPLTYGSHTFLIKATGESGIESAVEAHVTIAIPQIPAPVVTPSVIDNFVLLR
jgi:hypothetical protein